ncbi:hypothetical protein FLP15_02450 [Lactococcus protaetiae]|uniref:Probable multidrug resistance protein NorM n=1 Tax=Lactococcus protaetiae TaxID=2592653 RepID=A0A514Z6N6_9LACT|nr:MATE family efflux transporter [Lactococcus protaetiae]QDK70246.1 hypothetical protein FLP15_02450 [Lactococcus protaetiae]
MEDDFWKQVFNLALPVALQSLLYSLLAIVNQLMVGRLGEVSVVAVSLASKNFGILNFTLMGLSGGLAILTAQFMGKKKTEKITKMQGMMLFTGCCWQCSLW